MSNRWVVLAVVFLTRLSMGYQFQSIGSVGPMLVREVGLSYAELGLLTSVYMLPGAVFAVPGGVLGHRLGERRTVLGSLALMALGAVVTARAESFAMACAGRVVSGAGAVLMNILLARMVADWFAGRELSTAMAVMLTSWPVGLGLAAVTLGGVAAAYSWRAAVHLTALVAAGGLALMVVLYRDPPARGQVADPVRARLSRRDLWLSGSGGVAWGCFNASLVTLLTFGPGLLVARGAAVAEASAIVSLAVWVTMVSVPLGGLVADRVGRPDLVIAGGSLVAAAVIALLPAVPSPVLGFVLTGLVIGGPPGAIMALLPRALRPEVLTTGLGVYYAVFYVSMAVTQPVAGLLRDVSGWPGMPIVFAAVVMAATALALVAFRLIERRAAHGGAPAVTAPGGAAPSAPPR
jgi:MFS family permease